MKQVAKEVQEVLTNQHEVQFEDIADETSSPLNQPVVEKDIVGIANRKPETEEHEGSSPPDDEPENTTDSDDRSHSLDAPEQQIADEYEELDEPTHEEPGVEIPESHARQAADSLLGMTDNMLAVGGGFFVKISKHKEFYDFDEIVQVIEEQNEKNVSRIKLDEDDKILLRPLLIAILKKRAKKLTPEQQLMGALISIMVKKAQAVMEIRAENEILTERILDIIREEKGGTLEKPPSEETDQQEERDAFDEQPFEDEPLEEYEEVINFPTEEGISPASILEVAQEDETEKK
ncbi:MAG: hypothetical protein ABJQ69_03670 [Ekhidna sp.]